MVSAGCSCLPFCVILPAISSSLSLPKTELVLLLLPMGGWSSSSEALLDESIAIAHAPCKHLNSFIVLLAFVNGTIIKAWHCMALSTAKTLHWTSETHCIASQCLFDLDKEDVLIFHVRLLKCWGHSINGQTWLQLTSCSSFCTVSLAPQSWPADSSTPYRHVLLWRWLLSSCSMHRFLDTVKLASIQQCVALMHDALGICMLVV